ncbi:uncharacterized protein LOC124344161 [Daphnia pulicaria]|uniref:uncharacterized protein LOC124344161 n=1 Tax=Daphnia pulicaria TaxID=35523 RepID=UPI001EEB6EE5|nr:uncharacterized protein LOC124344161 [Daphnia pulicaria]
MESLADSTCNLAIKEVQASLDDEDADIILKTNDGTLKAHKFVLRGCPYFAAIVDGNWRESQASIITLDIFSYKSVRFVVEHIYKAKESIDSTQNLGELVALVDMLDLQSLLKLVCSTIILKICHNFHKPCKDCIDGVMCSFQLSSTYHLSDVQTKCLEWITKHFIKTWNSRPFSNLPEQLQQNCLQSLKMSMNVENIIDLTLQSQQLQEMLPLVKWAEPVNVLVKDLSNSCSAFTQQHFSDILLSAKFKSLGQEDTWSLSRVETIILEAAANLPVEQACLSYLALEKIMDDLLKADEIRQPPDPAYVEFIKTLQKAVENRLIQRVGMATKCSAWDAIPKPKQISIMQMGFFDPIDPKYSSDKQNPRRNVGRNHCSNTTTPINVAVPNTRAPRVALPIDPFRRTTLRSTVHGERNASTSQAVGRTPGALSASGTSVQQLNRRVPAVSVSRSQSARTPNVGTSRTTTSRSTSNQVASSQRSVNSTVPRTPIIR